MAAAIMREAYANPLQEAQEFCTTLMACVDPTLRAKLLEQRQPTLN